MITASPSVFRCYSFPCPPTQFWHSLVYGLNYNFIFWLLEKVLYKINGWKMKLKIEVGLKKNINLESENNMGGGRGGI